MWYVIQVLKGREDAMVELIGRVVPDTVLEEVFSPKYETEIKVRGTWQRVERDLLPGYLVAVTDAPLELEQYLLEIEEFARVLRQGEVFVPLAGEEIEVISAFTSRGERTVPMSMGLKVGERVMVTDGPLVGREFLIADINRRKSIADLEVNICGSVKRMHVGLALLSNAEDVQAKRAALYKDEALRSA